MERPKGRLGLVLSGGGARAAYQAGVLRAIAEMGQYKQSPFTIITGVSAGALNSTFLAANADDFNHATKTLWDFWEHLSFADVIDTSATSLLQIGTGFVCQIGLGGWLRKASSNHLLDASPLRRFLIDKIDFRKLRAHIASGALHGVAVSVTDYRDGKTVTFFDGEPSRPPLIHGFHLAIREPLQLEHILASSAIPIFFAPVRVGKRFYGDGGIRFNTPLSPAIHLDADAILAIGVRYQRTCEETLSSHAAAMTQTATLADITGVLLNSIFLDALDADVERMERMNRILALLPEEERSRKPEGLRVIPLRAVKPSRDLGTLAIERFDHFPIVLRHLLRGIGASRRQGWDLLSYLAFEGAYTGLLLKLGHADAMAQKDELMSFLETGALPKGQVA